MTLLRRELDASGSQSIVAFRLREQDKDTNVDCTEKPPNVVKMVGISSMLTWKKDRPALRHTSRAISPAPHLTLGSRAFSPLRMNSLSTRTPSSPETSSKMRSSNGANGTIRSVPSESQQLDSRATAEELGRTLSKSPSPSLAQMSGKPPLAWQNSKQLGVGNGLVRKLSSDFGPSKLYAGAVHVVENGASSPNGQLQESGGGGGQCTCGHVCGRGVGGGKSTSSFIEKVMGEREFYKRELEAERFKTQEANDALGFARSKMDQLVSAHETEIHEANMDRTLLKRRERQLEDMKGKIDIEKQRALAASEQEKIWKRDLDTMEAQCRKKVDDAEGYAAMMEAQNNTMVRHWKKKQAEVDKREASMIKTHQEFIQLVRTESEKSKRMNTICDQYRAENERLTIINKAQNELHETYKAANEESLRGLRSQGVEAGRKAEVLLKEAVELRDKLAWSLSVSKEFKDKPSSVDKLR